MLPSRRRIILCLSLAGLLTFVWIRSYYHADTILWGTPRMRVAVGFQPGRVMMIHNSIPSGSSEDFTRTGLHFYGPPWDKQRQPMAWIRDRAGVVYVSGHENNYDETTLQNGSPFVLPANMPPMNPMELPPGTPVSLRGIKAYYDVIGIPFWFLLLLSLTPLLPPLLRRPKPGLCPTCGYDLHATPTRCPECGPEISLAKPRAR